MDRSQEEGLYTEGTEAKKGNCVTDYSIKPSDWSSLGFHFLTLRHLQV